MNPIFMGIPLGSVEKKESGTAAEVLSGDRSAGAEGTVGQAPARALVAAASVVPARRPTDVFAPFIPSRVITSPARG
jgi:hypothetical protein